jgi:Protein of unknown function (DUF3152)
MPMLVVVPAFVLSCLQATPARAVPLDGPDVRVGGDLAHAADARRNDRDSVGRDIGVGRRRAPDGHLRRIPGASRRHGSGVEYRFTVAIEKGLPIDARSFARTVERILFSPRGWTAGGARSFRRVTSGPIDFRVTLASRRTTDALCWPAVTNGLFSCHNAGRVVINAWRWTTGAGSYGRRLGRYRIYVVNHEVGHALGHGHLGCPAAGERAPVMMPQTKGVGSCAANPWPLPYERRS